MNIGTRALLSVHRLERTTRLPFTKCVFCRLKTSNANRVGPSPSTSRTHHYTSPYKTLINSTKVYNLGPFYQQSRYLLGVSDNLASLLGSSRATDWNKAVTEAERIVGYPTSFMSLRCLLSDEFSNVAFHMRKLVGTKHPLLKTARRFLFDGTESMQIRGLLVLLVAKAAGPGKASTSSEESKDVLETMVSGIYPRQRNLAEITEMIHTAQLVHAGVVNISPECPPDHGQPEDVHFGNKLAVLCGDFLLANASTSLARLYNTYVVELISSAIRDMTAAEFTKSESRLHKLPSKEDIVTAWEKQTFLSTGSLLAKSCKSVLMLADHGEDCQEAGYQFGRSMGFAYQLHEELKSVLSPEYETASMTSLPVSLHLHNRPDDHEAILKLINFSSSRSQKQLLSKLSSSGTIKHARNLVQSYQEKALQAASMLGENEACTAITNMVRAVTEV